jgi:BlaI family penicillinase repressor
MKSPFVELTEAEWPVIKTVWDREPCTAPAVQEILEPATGWTYSTVRTVMDRMTAKGLLRARKEGKHTWYTSAITRAQAQHGELRYALKHAFNGALAPMVQCLLESDEITTADLQEIKRLIASRSQPAAGKTKTTKE